MTTEATIERLSTYENFRTWKFGGIEKALADRQRMLDVSKNTDFQFGPLKEGVIPDPAPWAGEPDKIQWIDPPTGLDCLVKRGPSGALCGYVGVPPEHPLHARAYHGSWDDDSSPDNLISVHGGITFSDFCHPSEDPDTICHVAAPGRPEKVWWFGFDCAHAYDLRPSDPWPMGEEDVYRDVTYVVGEVEGMAQQLASVGELDQQVAGAVESIKKSWWKRSG